MRRVLFLWALLISALANGQEVQVFSDWVAACDNLKTCSATSYAYNGSPFKQGFARIYRDAGAAATVHIALRVVSPKPRSASTVRVSMDGHPVGVFPDETLSVKASVTLLATLKEAYVLSLDAEGSDGIDISLNGLLAALRWIDDRQGRNGNVTALVARGSAPAAMVPKRPSPPFIDALPMVNQDGLPELDSQTLKSTEFSDCNPRLLHEKFERSVARLAADKIAWAIPCRIKPGRKSFARNLETILVMTDERGEHGTIFRLSVPAGLHGMLNDPSLSIELRISGNQISSVVYPDEQGNGQVIRWQWTGKTFEPFIINALQAQVIVGEHSEADYPLLYRAVLRNSDKNPGNRAR